MKPTNEQINVLDLMSDADREKMLQAKAKRDQATTSLITQEWLSLAELGVYYGWEAVRDVMNDVISIDQANMFIKGARKIHSTHVYDAALAYIAGSSTKKGAFEKIMSTYIDDMKAVA